jgi:hypothetical protein
LIFSTTWSINQPMFTGKVLRQALDKFLKGEVAANARVQVILPNGDFYDIDGVKLLENKIIGVRETHRLAITVSPEQWKMGKVIKKL